MARGTNALSGELQRQRDWLSARVSTSRPSERQHKPKQQHRTRVESRPRRSERSASRRRTGRSQVVKRRDELRQSRAAGLAVEGDDSESGAEIEVVVHTPTGGELAIIVSEEEGLVDLILALQDVDLEASVVGDPDKFVVMNSSKEILGGPKKTPLGAFGVGDGDHLYLRYSNFPTLYMLVPLHRRLSQRNDALSLLVTDVLLSVVGCALLVAGSKCRVWMGQWWSDVCGLSYRVPLTFETLVLAANASVLGPFIGVGAVLFYWLCIVLGFAVVAGDKSGPEVLFESTGGYVWGFVVAAFVGGRLCGVQGWDRRPLSSYLLATVVITIVYTIGLVWLPFGISFEFDTRVTDGVCGFGDGCLGNMFMWGVVPFVVGEVIKSLAVAVLLPLVWRAVTLWSMLSFNGDHAIECDDNNNGDGDDGSDRGGNGKHGRARARRRGNDPEADSELGL